MTFCLGGRGGEALRFIEQSKSGWRLGVRGRILSDVGLAILGFPEWEVAAKVQTANTDWAPVMISVGV